MRLAVECYADLDIFQFLKEDCGMPALSDFHAHSQGEVVNAVLVKRIVEVGMVDEDPGRSHHHMRDRARPLKAGSHIDVLELGGRHLLVVKPDLEDSFLRAMKSVGLESSFRDRSEMHQGLAGPRSRRHEVFRQELISLRKRSIEGGTSTFISELEVFLKGLLRSPPPK